MKDYYRILEIPGNATQPEIRKAYYKKAHLFHPDKTTDPKHHQIFLDINEAYEILGDKQKREMYHYRWVNFHNPPKAKVYTEAATQTASRPQTQQKAQPYYTAHYQNYTRPNYQEYEPILRRVCQVVLLISLVIMLDYVLAIPFSNEAILDYAIVRNKSQQTFWIYTEHTEFRIPFGAYQEISFLPGQRIDVYQTPLFKQIIKIGLNGRNWVVNQGSIYHNFFIVLLLQIGLAAAGLFKKFSWNNRMNFGTMAGLCALITFLIMSLT